MGCTKQNGIFEQNVHIQILPAHVQSIIHTFTLSLYIL